MNPTLLRLTPAALTLSFMLSALPNLTHATVADPGLRGGSANAGAMLPGLTTSQHNAFVIGQTTFGEVDSVSGTVTGEPGKGLGPSFNANSCAACHAQPAIGGSSPLVNPQVHIATLDGATNQIPSFITSNGPVREARFVHNADGSADGGVHDLFVITGRTDAPAGFNLAQTNFAAQVAANNVTFRIPTPTFGTGLIEAIPDQTIIANQQANAATKSKLGIAGHPNFSGNDGTITRFGWKAQNKSLLMFAGEAYHVEQGVTNDIFPNPRETGGLSTPLPHPEDSVDLATSGISDIENFMVFMRLLDAPKQTIPSGITSASVANGETVFNTVGCVMCHTKSMTTGSSPVAALSNQTVNLFSDLLVHHLGANLADGIAQGAAGGDEFRSAPLWGLGQRTFFLHDGRTSDLVAAIEAHSSNASGSYPASEANHSVDKFNNLTSSDQQDLLNFLRSL